MKTRRPDSSKVDDRKVFCENVSFIGYQQPYIKKGDLILYKETYTDGSFKYRLGKSHGRITFLDDSNPRILTQAASWTMKYTYEIWVDPKDVIEMVPKIYINQHIAKFFEEIDKEEEPDEVENTNYIVIRESFLGHLVDKVNQKIEEGYKCQGGISVAIEPDPGFTTYYQSMRLRRKKNYENK